MKICLACNRRFTHSDWRCPNCGWTPAVYYGYITLAPELAESNNGFNPNYFIKLAGLEHENFWFRSRNRLIVWALQVHFPAMQNYFEIGCGTGFVLAGVREAFPNLNMSGSEIYSNGLFYAEQRTPTAALFQMDANHIPFEHEFDVIGAFDVLEHIEEDSAVLEQMFQATKPAGGIILTVPQHRFLWSSVDDCSFHKRRYTRQELVNKVEKAGFATAYITSFVSLLLPLLLLSRMKKRTINTFDPANELAIHPILNSALGKIMDIERIMIQRGITFPFGGSLLLVAKKSSVKG